MLPSLIALSACAVTLSLRSVDRDIDVDCVLQGEWAVVLASGTCAAPTPIDGLAEAGEQTSSVDDLLHTAVAHVGRRVQSNRPGKSPTAKASCCGRPTMPESDLVQAELRPLLADDFV